MSTKSSNSSKGIKAVQDHYLDYPYPFRNPEEDKVRLMRIYGDYLGEINHYLFNGNKDFTKGFRVLIAGGGTGDSTVYLAKQLSNIPNSDVVYIDFSAKSMEIAQKRAEYQGVKDKITWICDSLLNIPKLNLGKFDYITCTGVLHHLASPDAGLKILADSLTEDGGMHIMIYGQYGRTGVYQMQEVMRIVNQGIKERAEEIKNAWQIIKSVPATNWFARGQELISDLHTMGDIGMYDLLLHKQDRSYTVPQVFEFTEKAGLHFVDWNSPHSRIMLDPKTYFADKEVLTRIEKLDKKDQYAIAEIMCCSIIKHAFYVSKRKGTKANFDDYNNVPFIFTIPRFAKQVSDYLAQHTELIGGTLNSSYKSDYFGDITLNIPISKYTSAIFKHMANSHSIGEIKSLVEKDVASKLTDQEYKAELAKMLPLMIDVGLLLMRHENIEITEHI